MNIFDLSPREFNDFLLEEAQYRSAEEINDLRRRYREQNSLAGMIRRGLTAEEGRRRSTFLPIDAPQGMSIWDAITSGEAGISLPQGLVDMLAGGVRAVESPAEYAMGIPPRADALGDAFNVAGMAMLGGGAVARPAGSLGSNSVREVVKKYPDVEIDIYGNPQRGYELGKIKVPEGQRGSGLGTQVMDEIVAAADAEGARVSLTPDTSFGGTSVSRLKDFYKRFGFVENKGKNKDFSTRNTMYRDPLMANASKSTGGITLWHGSPYDFNEFDMSKIGTGEGAQDLGRGFSLTDYEAQAHLYTNPASRWGDLAAMDRYRQLGDGGRYYRVDVNAKPEEFLDWNKPWRDQVPEGTPLYDAFAQREAVMLSQYADDPNMQAAIPRGKVSNLWRDNSGFEDAALKSGFVGNSRRNYSGDTEYTVFDPSLLRIDQKFDADGNIVAANASKSAGALTVAADVAERGDTILNMLKSGQADNITDAMLDMGDSVKNTQLNQYLFQNYDLPMDEASRMARAQEMGFDTSAYHGTDKDFQKFDPEMADDRTYGTGTWVSDDPDVAATYTGSIYDDPQTYPVQINTKNFGAVDWRGAGWGDGPEFGYMRYPKGLDKFSDKIKDIYPDWSFWASSDNAARAASQQGLSGVALNDIIDIGPNIFSRADTQKRLPETSASTAVLDPSKARSQFARFDPRLSHLSNLTAANMSPLGGLVAQGMVSQEELEEYLRQKGM